MPPIRADVFGTKPLRDAFHRTEFDVDVVERRLDLGAEFQIQFQGLTFGAVFTI